MKHFYLFTFILLNIAVFGQKLKTDLIKENLKGKVKSTHLKTYEAEKRNGKIEIKNADLIGLDVLELFNIKGYIVETRQFGGAGNNLIAKKTFKFDSKNLIIEESSGALTFKYKYIILNNSRFQMIVDYHDSKRTSLFDNNANIIDETSYSGKKINYNVIYKYDQYENLIKENYTTYEYYDINQYDSKRNLEKKTRYSANGKLIFIYKKLYTKYDSKGNWIESIDYDITSDKSGIPLLITKRNIEYY